MPSTFGTSIEKLGMQFGSVGLGGDDFSENSPYVLLSIMSLNCINLPS